MKNNFIPNNVNILLITGSAGCVFTPELSKLN